MELGPRLKLMRSTLNVSELNPHEKKSRDAVPRPRPRAIARLELNWLVLSLVPAISDWKPIA